MPDHPTEWERDEPPGAGAAGAAGAPGDEATVEQPVVAPRDWWEPAAATADHGDAAGTAGAAGEPVGADGEWAGGWLYNPAGDGSPGLPPLPPYPPYPPGPHLPDPGRGPWRGTVVALAILVLVLASGGLGAAIGVAVHDGPSTAGRAPSVLPTIPSFGEGGGGGGAGTPGTVAPTSGIDANAVARKVDPAVVDIDTTLAGGGRAAGTGVVLTSSGVVLTNNHVIAEAETIRVQVAGTGRTYNGTVVGYDVPDDIAVVQLQGASGVKTATLGNSSSLSVGAPVVAIGNALGQGGTPQATGGTVTALNQQITVRGDITPGQTLKGLIQFNAPIQSGDSGGPLVDADGHVVGLDTAAAFGGAFRSQLAPSDAGFAIPVNTAISLAHKITGGKAGGNIHIGPRPLIGVEVSDAGGGAGGGTGGFGGFGNQTPSAPVSSGALIEGVSSGTPASSIGLVPGDVIVSLDGQTVADAAGLSSAILQHKVGDSVSIGWVDQSGAHHSARVTFVAGPPA